MSSSSSPPSSSRSVSEISSSSSGSCRVEVISSSLGGSISVDSRAFAALQDHYSVPKGYELHAPHSGQRPYDSFPNGFRLTTDALEARLRFPLHPVIQECLCWWGISPSQMTPNSWCYLGWGRYYLTARSGFRISGAPSNNKGCKARYFFVSCNRGWEFYVGWTSWAINNVPPFLSHKETERVE
ncbi:hypothetical protein C4D60_Mb08t21140 [Musa balbisiana]|uniref:Uncharacterized protein n=1 Tax=Musa balbisiana TaxID=52838 RepID=A0A4S8K5B6_MUSBA|nr:hypothetical protein C4D60_Mb08t21140 [Musa balbisiana]